MLRSRFRQSQEAAETKPTVRKPLTVATTIGLRKWPCGNLRALQQGHPGFDGFGRAEQFEGSGSKKAG
jgi:hypothetical protein